MTCLQPSRSGSSLTFRLALLVLLTLIVVPALSAQTHPQASEMLRQMTLEEKIAQLSQLPGFPIPEFKEQAGEPQDIANAIAFLCSDLASYVTGIELNVSGGVELFVF